MPRAALALSLAATLLLPFLLRPGHARGDEEKLPKEPPANLDGMVLVPAGPAVKGYDHGKKFEGPKHRVEVEAFLIDVYEVTNFQYRRFVRATGYEPPPHWTEGGYAWGRDYHPVTNVRWEDALAYCVWAGKRLPTEAEWEKAGRGPEGRLYPYGDTFVQAITNNGDAEPCDTVRVDAHPEGKSPYGCFHMAGNVWEWIGDWFAPNYEGQEVVDPRGPPCGTMHVSKGGSWTTDAASCRGSFRCRSLPGARWGYCGFRCARSVVPDKALEPPGHEGMVLVPEGEFLMGSDGYYFGSPQRTIRLDAYRIDKTPVTNARYLAFCRATRHMPPPHWHNTRPPKALTSHPVTNVTLEDARAYAAWAGKTLPTEAQWEKAARGTDAREYPWGEDYDETRSNTIYAKVGHTVPVGTYPKGASAYGVLGMCGNVWEWVEGRWDPAWYAAMPAKNPNGARPGGRRVLRGGTWSTLPRNCRTYSRSPSLRGGRWGYCGFRCVARATAAGSEPDAPR